ncbi:MAG: ferritin [Parachlamydiaceae bacterium]|nr:ferritin [Parachlamydiaceae bacterium]
MNDKIFKALNEQIKHEFYSANLYLSMASYFENIPLEGFSKWFLKQSEEEREHGMKIYTYITDRNLHVHMHAIDQPTIKFKSPEEAFTMALEHEQKVTQYIHQLYELATKEKDYATQVFLQWFITEQVEEEKNAQDNLDRIKLVGSDKAALFIIDQKLGALAS